MKRFSVVFTIFVLLTLSASCASSGGKITTIDIPSDNSECILVCGEIYSGEYLTVSAADDFSPQDIEFISQDSNVAVFSYSRSENKKIYYKIKAVDEGETYVYAKAKMGNIKSEKIKVTVKPSISSITFNGIDEINLQADGKEQICLFSVTPDDLGKIDPDGLIYISEDESVAVLEAAEDGLSSSPYSLKITPVDIGETSIHIETSDGLVRSEDIKVTVIGAEPNSDLSAESDAVLTESGKKVFITPSGKKYHFNRGCAGDNSYSASLEQALEQDKESCKRCAQ